MVGPKLEVELELKVLLEHFMEFLEVIIKEELIKEPKDSVIPR